MIEDIKWLVELVEAMIYGSPKKKKKKRKNKERRVHHNRRKNK